MDCSMPGFPVYHHLPKLTQTHVHQVSDAIQPSHPLLSPSPPTSIFPSIRVFSNESVLRLKWPKYWNFNFSISPYNEYSGLISFRIDWLDLLAGHTIYNYNEAKFIFASNFTISDQKVVRTDDRKIYWTVTVSPVLCVLSSQISMLLIRVVSTTKV